MDRLQSARAAQTLARMNRRQQALARSAYFRPATEAGQARREVRSEQSGPADAPENSAARDRDRGRQTLDSAQDEVFSSNKRARKSRRVIGMVLAELVAFFTLGMM